MAVPVVLVKAAAMLLTDEKIRKKVGWVIVAILSPVLLVVILLVALLTGAQQNRSTVDLVFRGGDLTGVESAVEIQLMRDQLTALDTAISELTRSGAVIDSYQAKAAFYALFFGADPGLSTGAYERFASCFDAADLDAAYAALAGEGWPMTEDQRADAANIYTFAKYGFAPPGSLVAGSAMGEEKYAALIVEGEKYLGDPYVWGGSSPSTSFDCSGFVCWVYTHSGVYSLPRTTATGIYGQCAVVSRDDAKPGDLIFFTGTYDTDKPISHIGIYVGEGKMLHCGSPIQYADVTTSYWRQHFYGYGRLPITP